jgi:hypothetical protein
MAMIACVKAPLPAAVVCEVTPNCFIARDANGQVLSYVYYESETGSPLGGNACAAYLVVVELSIICIAHGFAFCSRSDAMARSAQRMSQVLVDTPSTAADFSMASLSVCGTRSRMAPV